MTNEEALGAYNDIETVSGHRMPQEFLALIAHESGSDEEYLDRMVLGYRTDGLWHISEISAVQLEEMLDAIGQKDVTFEVKVLPMDDDRSDE
jgi:predicted RNA-binding protein with RPS1 domain